MLVGIALILIGAGMAGTAKGFVIAFGIVKLLASLVSFGIDIGKIIGNRD